MAAYTNEELYGPCPCGSGKKLKFCCKDGLVRRPTETDAREIELAIDEANADNLAAGRARLEKAIAAGSQEVMAHAVLASMLATAGDDDAAIARARATLAIVPGHVSTNGLLAHLLAARGDVDEANAIADRLMRAQIKDGRDAHAVLLALGLLERDRDVVSLCEGLFGQMTNLLAWAYGVASLNLGDTETATRMLMAALQDRFDDLGAILLQIARGTGPTVPWPRHGVLHPAVWLPGERTLAALTALDTREAPLTDVAHSEVLAKGLRQLALTAMETDDVNGTTNVAAAMAMLAPSVARRELAFVVDSSLGSAEARALFAAASMTVLSSSATAETATETPPTATTPTATPPTATSAQTLSLFDAPPPPKPSSSSISTLPTPVAQFSLFGDAAPPPPSKATKAKAEAKKPTLPTLTRESRTAAWYEGSSIGELRRFLDAFGVEHDGVKKKSGLLTLWAHAVEDGDLVVEIVNELREHEDLYDVTDALIDAGGITDLDDMMKRFGVPKEGDELSDLDMLLANGLAVQAVVDGKASIALPTPIRLVLCEATREEA